MLQALQCITGKYVHVFPHRDVRTRPMVSASFRQMLNVLGWGGKYSPHATRTTGSTRLNEMGFSADWIERQLAHTEQNAVRRTYNHAEYLADRAKMMQQWADMLEIWKISSEDSSPPPLGLSPQHGLLHVPRVGQREHSLPARVCELALAHDERDQTEAAYSRSDFLEKRRALMADWANFCTNHKRQA